MNDSTPKHVAAWVTRAESSTDLRAIREINLAAFPTSEEADLVESLRADAAWIPELSVLAATPSGTPVGYALLTRCHIGHVPGLALGPCAVVPEHQGTGAGSAVIEYGLDVARKRGEAYAVVLGHPEYYPRFGFRRASAHGISLPIDVPDEAFLVLSLDSSELPAGTVRYPPPFGV